MPATENISSGYCGQTFHITISVTQDGENKNLGGITAATFKLNTPNTAVTKSLGSGIVVNDAPNTHQLIVTLLAADTASVAPDVYPYQVWITDAAADKAPVTVGTLELKSALN